MAWPPADAIAAKPAARPSRGRRAETLTWPMCHYGSRKHARRVRYLHHHFLGARSVHLPAIAKRAWPAHRAGASALRSLFCPRTGAPGGRKDRHVAQSHAGSDRAETGRADRTLRRALERRCRSWFGRSRPASMPSLRADANFDGKHFLTGARAAYEMIVNAYRRRRPPHVEESAGARSL